MAIQLLDISVSTDAVSTDASIYLYLYRCLIYLYLQSNYHMWAAGKIILRTEEEAAQGKVMIF